MSVLVTLGDKRIDAARLLLRNKIKELVFSYFLWARALAMAVDLSVWKRRAEAAREQAEGASVPETRQAFLAVAHMWQTLIDRCENMPLLLLFSPRNSGFDDPEASQ